MRATRQQVSNKPDNLIGMLNNQGRSRDDDRLDKLEKKIRSLFTLFIGYLLGHFLGCLLFP